MGRKLPLRVPALGANGLEQVFTHALQLLPSSVPYPIAALKAKGEAQVHELQQVQIAAGECEQALESVKKLLAAPCLVVKADQESALGPDALAAPGGVEHRLVYQGAQHVAGGQHHRVGESLAPGALLECPDLANQLLAKPFRIGV